MTNKVSPPIMSSSIFTIKDGRCKPNQLARNNLYANGIRYHSKDTFLGRLSFFIHKYLGSGTIKVETLENNKKRFIYLNKGSLLNFTLIGKTQLQERDDAAAEFKKACKDKDIAKILQKVQEKIEEEQSKAAPKQDPTPLKVDPAPQPTQPTQPTLKGKDATEAMPETVPTATSDASGTEDTDSEVSPEKTVSPVPPVADDMTGTAATGSGVPPVDEKGTDVPASDAATTAGTDDKTGTAPTSSGVSPETKASDKKSNSAGDDTTKGPTSTDGVDVKKVDEKT